MPFYDPSQDIAPGARPPGMPKGGETASIGAPAGSAGYVAPDTSFMSYVELQKAWRGYLIEVWSKAFPGSAPDLRRIAAIQAGLTAADVIRLGAPLPTEVDAPAARLAAAPAEKPEIWEALASGSATAVSAAVFTSQAGREVLENTPADNRPTEPEMAGWLAVGSRKVAEALQEPAALTIPDKKSSVSPWVWAAAGVAVAAGAAWLLLGGSSSAPQLGSAPNPIAPPDGDRVKRLVVSRHEVEPYLSAMVRLGPARALHGFIVEIAALDAGSLRKTYEPHILDRYRALVKYVEYETLDIRHHQEPTVSETFFSDAESRALQHLYLEYWAIGATMIVLDLTLKHVEELRGTEVVALRPDRPLDRLQALCESAVLELSDLRRDDGDGSKLPSIENPLPRRRKLGAPPTKRELALQENFVKAMDRMFRELGARVVPSEHYKPAYWFETLYGPLQLHIMDGWVAGRFNDSERAAAALNNRGYQVVNPFSGKWNHHFNDGALLADVVDNMRHQLTSVTLGVSQPNPVAGPRFDLVVCPKCSGIHSAAETSDLSEGEDLSGGFAPGDQIFCACGATFQVNADGNTSLVNPLARAERVTPDRAITTAAWALRGGKTITFRIAGARGASHLAFLAPTTQQADAQYIMSGGGWERTFGTPEAAAHEALNRGVPPSYLVERAMVAERGASQSNPVGYT